MASAAAAALLDELMGRSRNEVENGSNKIINWEDPEYCKYYMVQFCPHDLFVNTKADLGACTKIHCDLAKHKFEMTDNTYYLKSHYEDEFIRFAQGMLTEVERKIIKGEQRLALMGKSESSGKQDERLIKISERINELVNEAEQLGIQGKVDEAQATMRICDELKEERERIRKAEMGWTTLDIAVAQEKQMEVCKVCGAFLIVGDAQSRIEDHLMGKQHTGYGRLKIAVEELLRKKEAIKAEKEKKREEQRSKRLAEREREEKKVEVGTKIKTERSRSPRSREKDKLDRDRKRDDRSHRGDSRRSDKSESKLDRSRQSPERGVGRNSRERERNRDRTNWNRDRDRFDDRGRGREINGGRLNNRTNNRNMDRNRFNRNNYVDYRDKDRFTRDKDRTDRNKDRDNDKDRRRKS